MNNPYRQNEKKMSKKLPRFKARLRGLYRRVILPTKIVALLFVAGAMANGCWAIDNHSSLAEKKLTAAKIDEETKHHFDDWQKSINEQQAKLQQREDAFQLRKNNFEEMVIFSALSKNGDNVGLLDAIRKNREIK